MSLVINIIKTLLKKKLIMIIYIVFKAQTIKQRLQQELTPCLILTHLYFFIVVETKGPTQALEKGELHNHDYHQEFK